MITNKMFRWFVIKDNFLDKQTCEELIKYCDGRENKNTELSTDYYVGGTKTQYDDPSLFNKDEMGYTEQELWEVEDKVLINNVWSLFKTSNDIYYKFKIDQLWGNTLLVRKYNLGSFTGPHSDFATGREIDTLLKLTCIVYLNDDYTGGETEIMTQKIPPKTGRAVIFPSFALHRSMEHDNNRYMLIGWAIGDTFV